MLTSGLGKSFLISWLLLALTACVTTYDRPQKKVDMAKALETHIRLGLQYLRQNNLDSSRFHLNKALKIDPNSAGTYSALAALMLRERDEENAEKFYLKAIRLDSSFSQARNNYGSYLFGKKRYADSLRQFEAAAGDLNYERRPLAFNNVGLAHIALGNVDQAENAFVRSVTLNPNMARPYLELAKIAQLKNELAAAQELLNQFHALSPPTPASLQMQIDVAQALGNKNLEASARMKLKNLFPNRSQYQLKPAASGNAR